MVRTITVPVVPSFTGFERKCTLARRSLALCTEKQVKGVLPKTQIPVPAEKKRINISAVTFGQVPYQSYLFQVACNVIFIKLKHNCRVLSDRI